MVVHGWYRPGEMFQLENLELCTLWSVAFNMMINQSGPNECGKAQYMTYIEQLLQPTFALYHNKLHYYKTIWYNSY